MEGKLEILLLQSVSNTAGNWVENDLNDSILSDTNFPGIRGIPQTHPIS